MWPTPWHQPHCVTYRQSHTAVSYHTKYACLVNSSIIPKSIFRVILQRRFIFPSRFMMIVLNPRKWSHASLKSYKPILFNKLLCVVSITVYGINVLVGDRFRNQILHAFGWRAHFKIQNTARTHHFLTPFVLIRDALFYTGNMAYWWE